MKRHMEFMCLDTTTLITTIYNRKIIVPKQPYIDDDLMKKLIKGCEQKEDAMLKSQLMQGRPKLKKVSNIASTEYSSKWKDGTEADMKLCTR